VEVRIGSSYPLNLFLIFDYYFLMKSATWPKSIRQLASDYLDNFVQINVGSTSLTANANIEQKVIFCRNEEKRELLLKLLQEETEANDGVVPRTLVFVDAKRKADDIQAFLNYKRYTSVSVHGDKTQRMRSISLEQFRSGDRDVLVATDVAARGLDVSNIKLVINFDMANTIEDHVHRIGRTGRANCFGKAISFFTNDNSALAPPLANLMKRCNQQVDPKLLEIVPQPDSDSGFRYRNKGFNNNYNRGYNGGYNKGFNNNYKRSARPFNNRYEKFSDNDPESRF
jgi:ATP-dependent RNA helicase DDX5/DBP2